MFSLDSTSATILGRDAPNYERKKDTAESVTAEHNTTELTDALLDVIHETKMAKV